MKFQRNIPFADALSDSLLHCFPSVEEIVAEIDHTNDAANYCFMVAKQKHDGVPGAAVRAVHDQMFYWINRRDAAISMLRRSPELAAWLHDIGSSPSGLSGFAVNPEQHERWLAKENRKVL